jgi:hypothetical protein
VLAGFPHSCFYPDLSSVLSLRVLTSVCCSVFDSLAKGRPCFSFCFLSGEKSAHESCVLLHFLGFHRRPVLISASSLGFFCAAFVSTVTDHCSRRTSIAVVPTRRQQIHFPTHIFSACSEERAAGSLPRLDCPRVSLITRACSSAWPGSSVPRSCSFFCAICSLIGSRVFRP